MLVYYTNPNPALLYTDAKTHLGHFRVARWSIDKKIFRFKIIEEFINESEVLFVDYGNSEDVNQTSSVKYSILHTDLIAGAVIDDSSYIVITFNNKCLTKTRKMHKFTTTTDELKEKVLFVYFLWRWELGTHLFGWRTLPRLSKKNIAMLRGQIMGRNKRGSEEPYMCVCRGFNALFFFQAIVSIWSCASQFAQTLHYKKEDCPVVAFCGVRRNMSLQKHSFVVIDCCDNTFIDVKIIY